MIPPTTHARRLASTLSSSSRIATAAATATAPSPRPPGRYPPTETSPSSSLSSSPSPLCPSPSLKSSHRLNASRRRAEVLSKLARSQTDSPSLPLIRPSLISNPAPPSSHPLAEVADILRLHPYQGSQCSAHRPFDVALHLLSAASVMNAQIDAKAIVDVVHPSALETGGSVLPPRLLDAVLRMKMDTETLLRLAKPVISATQAATDLDPAVHLLASYTTRAVQLKVLPMVSVMSSLFIQYVEDAFNHVSSLSLLLEQYETFLSAFVTTLPSPTWTARSMPDAGKMPAAVVNDVDRVIRHFINTIQRAPSSSTSRPSLASRPSLLRLVFASDLLSNESFDLITAHCREIGFELEEYHLKGSINLAMRNKDYEAVQDRLERLKQSNRASNGVVEENAPSANDPSDTTDNWEVIEELAQSLNAKSIGDVIETFRSRLGDTKNEESSRLAWSVLSTRLGKSNSVTPDMLVSFANRIPTAALTATVLTPIMHGLLNRGEPGLALKVWQGMLVRAREVTREGRSAVLDATALAVAAEATFQTSGLDAAIVLVDRYAARGPKRRYRKLHQSIIIDAGCVNVLLGMCNREGRASVAFRLWAAAKPRWNVDLDGVSLTLLLDTARFGGESGKASFEHESMHERLQMLADGFRIRRSVPTSETDEYKAELAKGLSASLLDQDKFSWRREFGTRRAWQMAREVVREIVFGNYPWLKGIKSPLEHPSYGFEMITSLFVTSLPSSNQRAAGYMPGSLIDPASIDKYIPSPNAQHTSLTITPNALHAYVALLGHVELAEEIPLALAWARELGIKPTRKCLTLAMLHVGQAEGPRRRVKGWRQDGKAELVRDEDIMRRWLEVWVGEGEVPEEEEVAALWRAIQHRRSEARRGKYL